MLPNTGKSVEKLVRLFLLGRNVQCSIAWERSMKVSYKTEHATTIPPSNCTLEHLSQKNEKLSARENLYMCVHGRFFHNSQKLETAQMTPFSE